MEGDRGQSAGRPGSHGAGGTEVGGVEIAMPFKLVPFTGDQDFDLSAKNAYIVGRAVTSDIPIFDPTISRRHAELVPHSNAVTVKRLGSSTGTFINGPRVTEGTPAANDSVTFGKVVFQLKSLDVTPLR